MLIEKMCHLVCAFLLIDQASRKRGQTVDEDRPGAPGRKRAAEVFPIHQKRRVKLARCDHGAIHIRSKATDVFRQALRDEIGPERQRPLTVRRGKTCDAR